MKIDYKTAKRVMDMFDTMPKNSWSDISKLFYEECSGNRELFVVMFTAILREMYYGKSEEQIRETLKDTNTNLSESEVEEFVEHADFLLGQTELLHLAANLIVDRIEIDSGKMEINVE